MWRSKADVRAHRESEPVKEATAFGQVVAVPGERRGPFEVLRLA